MMWAVNAALLAGWLALYGIQIRDMRAQRHATIAAWEVLCELRVDGAEQARLMNLLYDIGDALTEEIEAIGTHQYVMAHQRTLDALDAWRAATNPKGTP
jgi:hypothetical protein